MYKKGYTIIVTTYKDDDGRFFDHSIHVETIEQANAIVMLTKFFTNSDYNKGINRISGYPAFGNARYNKSELGYHTRYKKTYFNLRMFINLILIGYNDLYHTLVSIDKIENIFESIIDYWESDNFVHVVTNVKVIYLPEDATMILDINL